MLKLNNIYHGDSENLISELSDNSIDLVITSPPYNVDLGNNKYNRNPYDLYQDNKDHKKFIEWLASIFDSLKSKMVIGGRICINIGDGKNGSVPTHSDIIQFMTKELKYLIKTIIVWNKNQIGNRTSWGSWRSPSNPSFPTPFEYILIFCNESQYKEGDRKHITISKEEFTRNSLALWEFAPESQMMSLYDHPAMFPLELPYRLIQHLSYVNDVVLDPFSGMGTTCLAAAILERRWLGFELSEEYANRSIKRIKRYTDQERLFPWLES
jgi:DNA modification methylase